MRRALRLCFAISMLLTFFSAKEASAWGRKGHMLLAEIAAELAPVGNNFWRLNARSIGQLSLIPDSRWKSGKTAPEEKPSHWFQIDAYTQKPWIIPTEFDTYSQAESAYNQATILENGTALWRTEQFYNLAVDSIRSHNIEEGLQMAGILSHYVGDLSQPLHVSINFDGPSGQRTGLHSYFETDNLQGIDSSLLHEKITLRARELLRDKSFSTTFQGTFHQGIALEISRAADNIEKIFTIEESYGREDKGSVAMQNLAIERLADGAASLALVFAKIWMASGNPPLTQVIAVPSPEWIAPDYQGRSFGFDVISDDDCDNAG